MLQIACTERADLPRRAEVSAFAHAAMRASGARVLPGTELVVRLVDSDEGAALNAGYRGRNGPTNVLSFAFESPPGMPAGTGADAAILGDLVLCEPVLRREAGEQGKTLAAHLAHMVVHGTLHLLGHDHRTDDDAVVMESIECAAMTRLGFDDPYRKEKGT